MRAPPAAISRSRSRAGAARNRRHSRGILFAARFANLSVQWLSDPAAGILSVPASSVLIVLVDLRFFTQHGVEQRTVNLDLSVVVDEAFLPEFVHEETDPGSRGADHFRQRFLAEGNVDRRVAAFLAEIGKQQ